MPTVPPQAPQPILPIPVSNSPGGKPVRQDSLESIIRDLQKRVALLENALALISAPGSGVRFTSPDGLTHKLLSIDNTGTPVWTTVT